MSLDREVVTSLVLGTAIASATAYSAVTGMWGVALVVADLCLPFFLFEVLDKVGTATLDYLVSIGKKELAKKVDNAFAVLLVSTIVALFVLSIVYLVVVPAKDVLISVLKFIIVVLLIFWFPLLFFSVGFALEASREEERKEKDTKTTNVGNRNREEGRIEANDRREEVARELEELRERLARAHR